MALFAAEFIGSPEFRRTVGPDASNLQFLDTIYVRAFGRAPDSWGRDFWLGEMDRGVSRAIVLLSLSESEEAQERTDTSFPEGYRPLILRLEGRGDARRTVCVAEPSLYRTAATNSWEQRDADTEMRVLDDTGAVVGELQVGSPRTEWEGVAGEEGMFDSWARAHTIEIDTAAEDSISIDTDWSIQILPVSFALPADPVSARGSGDAVRQVFVPADRSVDLWTDGTGLRVTAYDGLGRFKSGVLGSGIETEDGVLAPGVTIPAGTGFLYVDVTEGQRCALAATPVKHPARATDPRGDVVASGWLDDFPNYDPRADLLAYTLSFTGDRVWFALTTAHVEPSRLDDVWVGFDVDVIDATGYPDFAVFRTLHGNVLHELSVRCLDQPPPVDLQSIDPSELGSCYHFAGVLESLTWFDPTTCAAQIRWGPLGSSPARSITASGPTSVCEALAPDVVGHAVQAWVSSTAGMGWIALSLEMLVPDGE